MTGQERRTKLATDSQLDMYWKVILGLEAFSAVMLLFVGFATGATGLAFGSIFGFLAAIIWVVLIIAFLVVALIAWGVYNIERWVVILMWIGAIGSLLNLLGHFNWNNIVQLAIYGFSLYAYRKILAFVNPGETAPRAPTTPAPKV
jgi:hypothetical protein